jgi:SAM-dependent methyltransferase
MDPAARFGNRSDDYARYRPTYPRAVIEAILDGFDAPVVADLGAGTGISSQLLADAGARVYAIEPNAAMRARIEPTARIEPIDASAEHTLLPAESVDVIAAFQAYHWFSVGEVLEEAARIRRVPARFAAVWNLRDRSDPFTAAYEAVTDAFDESNGAVDASRRSGAVVEDLRSHGWRDVRVVRAQHRMPLGWEGMIGLARSTSYLPRDGERFAEMESAYRRLYEEWKGRGTSFAWLTEAYLGEA